MDCHTEYNSKKNHGKRLPTAPAHAARLRMFQPTQRPRRITQAEGSWIETAWGKVRVDGRLGQRHADLIETICSVGQRPFLCENGSMLLLVDPHEVRKTMGSGGYSHQQIWRRLLREIMAAVVTWEADAGLKGLGHIIDDVAEASVTARNPLTGKPRKLWRVTIGAAWVQLLGHDIRLYHDPRPVIDLRHGVSQAAARLMLTHKPGFRVGIETVLDQIGIPETGQARRNARRRITEDAAGMERCGITVDNGTLHRATPAR